MSDQTEGVGRRGILIGGFAAALTQVLPKESDAQSWIRESENRMPSRNGYPNILLETNDSLEPLERGVRGGSQDRWQQRMILLAEDAFPEQAIRALANWAQHDALANTHMSPDSSNSLHLQQSKLIAGAAMVYLRSKNAADPLQQRAIEDWLSKRANQIQNFVENANNHQSFERHSNHRTWAGLAVGATGMALGTRDTGRLYEWGRMAVQRTIDNIQPDGSLRSEAEQPWEALNPLFAFAQLAAARGDNLYAGQNSDRMNAAAQWGVNILKNRLASGTVQAREGQQRTGTQQRDNIRPHDHAFLFAGLYVIHASRNLVQAPDAARQDANKLLDDFMNRSRAMQFSESSGRRGGRGRQEVPVHSFAGGSVTDITSIGRGLSR